MTTSNIFNILLRLLTIPFVAFTVISTFSSAQDVNLDGSYPRCDAASDMIMGTNGWIYEYWEWNSPYTFTAAEDIVDMNNAFKKRGINFFIVPVPNRTAKYSGFVDLSKYHAINNFILSDYIKNWNDMIGKTDALGINAVNLMPSLQAYNVGSRGETFFYPRDHHWTTSGAEVSSQVVAKAIRDLIARDKISVKIMNGTLKVVKSGFNSGSFGDHYAEECKNRPANMDAYKATNTFPRSALLEDSKAQLDIFGDSFGLASPDNNFSTFIEHYTGLSTVNYSTPGIGSFGSLIGYLADPKVSAQLPKFVVVPMLSWLPNEGVLYRQVTAEVTGCSKVVPDSYRKTTTSTSKLLYLPPKTLESTWNSIHIKLATDAIQVHITVHYDDTSSEELLLTRNTNDYYKGNRRDFYVTLSKNKKISTAEISVDNKKSFTADVQLCKI